MGFTIDDGTGSGVSAEVNSDKQVLTKAVVESEFEFVSDFKGLSFSWSSVTFDPNAADTILLVKNTSTTLKLHIDSVTISADVETIVQIHLPTTDVTVAGTTVVGVNLNTTSNNVSPLNQCLVVEALSSVHPPISPVRN